MINFVTGLRAGFTADPAASTLQPAVGISRAGGGRPVPSLVGRDGQVAQLGEITSAVNALQQIAGAQSLDAATAPMPTVPPAPPMPIRHAPANAPTDDHGKSNVVFTDDNVDASLIH